MTDEYLQTLYAYSTWANGRIFEAAARLTPAQFRADGGASFGSARDTLVHLVSAQRVWFARCRNLPALPALQPGEYPDAATVRSVWNEVDGEMCAYVAGLDEDALAGIVRYVNSAGALNAYPLWQVLFHQANHAAQHRAEVAMLLTAFDCSPGGLDFLYYLDQQGANS